MLPSEVAYAAPTTLEEALRLLGEHDAAVLAGGQTLVNVMKARLAAPEVVVDVGRVEELRGIRVAGGALEVGATVTYAELADSDEVRAARPLLAEVAGTIADVQVRNRGTIGGNLCWADPTNHLPPLVVAVGATIAIRGRDGEREVPADDFFLGPLTTAVAPDEVLTRVRVPARRDGEGDGFASVRVGREGTGIVNVAASVRLAGGAVESARVVLGCVAATPVRARTMEAALAGTEPDEDALHVAAAGLGGSLAPPSTAHASAGYRRHLAEVLAVRAVAEALEEARR